MAEWGEDDPFTDGPSFGEDDPVTVGADILSTALEGTGRRALDSFFLGFGDEIIAGAQAAFGADYEEALAESEPQTQAAQEAARERSMVGVDPLDLAGLATGGGALFQGAKALPFISKLPGLAKSAIGGGAVGGAVAGGQPGSLEQRVGNVPYGAAVGAVAGPAAQGAAKVVGSGAGALRDLATRFLPGAQKKRGMESLARTFDSAERTTQMAREDLERYGPQAIIADVGGPNMREAAQRSVELRGKSRNQAEGLLLNRNLEQGDRLGKAFRDAVEEKREFYTVADDLNKARRVEAAPLYKSVHAQTIQPTDRMRDMVDRQSFKDGYREARAIATEDGVKLPTLKQLQDGEADLTGLKTWDYIKRGMDESIARMKKTQGVGPSRKRAANQTRVDLLEDLDKLHPPYAEARAAWAGPSRSMDMLEEGRDIFDSRDPEEFLRDYARLDPAEKDFFKLGAVQEITNRIGNVGTNRDALGSFWNKPNQQRKLAALFPKGDNMTKFMDRVIGEEEAIKTAREVLGQSATAGRQARSDQAAIESMPGFIQAVTQLARGDLKGLAASQASAMAKRNRIPLGQREAEAQVLFEPSRAKQLEYLDQMDQAGPSAIARTLSGATQAGAAGLGAGGAARNQNARDIARFFTGGS